MKRGFAILLVFLLSLSTSLAFAADNAVNLKWDSGSFNFDVPPQILNGRTMVPIRALFEEFGYELTWNAKTKTAICDNGYQVVSVVLDDPIITITGDHIQGNYGFYADVPATIIDGRMLLPLRVISVIAGLEVGWDAETRTVLLKGKVKNITEVDNK